MPAKEKKKKIHTFFFALSTKAPFKKNKKKLEKRNNNVFIALIFSQLRKIDTTFPSIRALAHTPRAVYESERERV